MLFCFYKTRLLVNVDFAKKSSETVIVPLRTPLTFTRFTMDVEPEEGGVGPDQPVPENDERNVEDPIDHGEAWHWLFRFIVHRHELVQDAHIGEYDDSLWTDLIKRAPFPFNLDSIWYCGLLLVAILGLHVELDVQWLLRSGYLHYTLRVLSRAFLTLMLAVVSTLAYECIGSSIDVVRSYYMYHCEHRVLRWLILRLGWGEVNADGEPAQDNDGRYLWFRDPTHIREPVRQALVEIALLFVNYSLSCSSEVIVWLFRLVISWVIIPILRVLSPAVATITSSLPTILMLPTPDPDVLVDSKLLFWEYGIPAIIQLWMSVFLWLLVFLYMAKSEWLAMTGGGRFDPKYMLYFHLIRATAMHLLAYTAYQIVCTCVVGINSFNYGFLRQVDSSMHRLVTPGTSQYHGSIGAAILLLLTHYILQRSCSLGVSLVAPLWTPFIVWRSEKTELGTDRTWPVWKKFMENDFQILNPDTKVLSRVVMTALFGLRSSWPARFRLSTAVDEVNLQII
ncbi:hypothetical protein F4810DRAFT_540034 [Camillea tinctor]|nr:hypothetical protein F4810DRAFT_540034 [Camillea tinctor]